MRLGLDLDGTLIPEKYAFASGLEPQSALARALRAEPLRMGLRALGQEARSRGWQLWVYTSSARSVLNIHSTFWLHGVRIDGVINDQRHRDEEHRQRRSLPVKFPPAFGIDLLVDDSVSVEQQGQRHGFRVVRVAPDDREWVGRVLGAMVASRSP